MMIDRLAGNAALKDSVRLMLGSSRLTHSVLLVGETGLGAGYAARCVAADYLYPAGGAPAEALLRGECCRAVGKAGDRDSGRIETGVVREAISVTGMGSGGRYLVSQVKAMPVTEMASRTTPVSMRPLSRSPALPTARQHSPRRRASAGAPPAG